MRPVTAEAPAERFPGWPVLRRLLPYLWPRDAAGLRLRVVLSLLCLALSKATNVVVPIFFGRAVDALDVAAGAAVTLPLGLILAYGLARVGSLAFAELRDALFVRVSQRAMRRVAVQVFQHLHALSLRFHLERQTGGLSRAIERGVKGIETLLSFALFNILPTLLEIVLVSGLLWWMFGFAFGALTFVTVTVYIVFTVVTTEWRLKFRREMNEQDSAANTRAIDSLLNYETVKYFTAEAHERTRYDGALAGYERAAVTSQRTLSLLNIGQQAIVSLGLTAIMLMAAAGIADGRMSLGDFVLVNTYLIQLYQPLNFFGFVYRNIKQSLVDMEKMFGLLDRNTEIADSPGAQPLQLAGGTLVFEDVRFGYDADRTILKGLSFTVPAGGTLAIVGPSGAGKSTIGRLLFRFYDPTAGRILLDGQDLRAVTQDSLRRQLGIVPQDTVLFNDSIGYNIAYGRQGASEAEVRDAARLAAIDGFVAGLPQGYATMVGERGLKLSGGEKQRVAIARTVLKNPPILLFDEATSALDTRTERQIQDSLDRIAQGRTTLIVAHRLSTVVGADSILVLQDGQAVEQGTHAELLARGGLYAQMWAQQQAE